MSKLYSSDLVIKVLLREGFVFVSQKGSHAKYVKDAGGGKTVVIIPIGRREIPRGTFKSILRQSRLSLKDFGE